jgi:hypothetical protein
MMWLYADSMGAGASVTQDEVKSYPQYAILGGDSKFAELKDEEGKVTSYFDLFSTKLRLEVAPSGSSWPLLMVFVGESNLDSRFL